ncbi:MAG: hypothetical protein JSR48_10185 [Verrucomicrobia bacterium]|nr:hypothetical protein [Verrucomicrobiota bacterium]
MKLLVALIALVALPGSAHAMVYGDSKILDREGLKAIGVSYLARRGPDGLKVTVSAEKTGGPPRFESMSCIVLRQAIDAAAVTADAAKRGFVVTTKWGREERRETSRELRWTFAVPVAEVARAYLIVRLNLPPKEGVPVFGTYYLLLGQIE